MGKYKKEKLSFNRNRPVLSDVLPYELPIIFTNRYFYKFLSKHKIVFFENQDRQYEIKYNKLSEAQQQILKLLFNYPQKIEDKNQSKISHTITIPFNFKVVHKEGSFRELSIIHPLNQLNLVWIYNEYSELIRYLCSKSKFSIRKPYKVAKFKKKRDPIYYKDLSFNEDDSIEEDGKEYENLKSFFSYKKYSNIHKFYESYKYQRAEKKFNALMKFDISKCFDSIYTHSISWACYNKNMIKDTLSSRSVNTTFAAKLDEFMQRTNYNETNGIVIGPEFSRIFAEVILQKIDDNVYTLLSKEKIYHKKDYEIYRYVDDYFIFYNDENIKDKIFEYFHHALKEYKLYVNDNKTVEYNKPIITELTIAKEKINDLLENYLKIEVDNELEEVNFSLYLNSQKLITRFKIIVKETNIEYKHILNWTFAIVDRKVRNIIKEVKSIENIEYESKIIKFILEILDFSFFIYSVYPRTNTTIKICTTLSLIVKLLRNSNSISFENKHLVYKKIHDEIMLILKKNSIEKYAQVETSYLILILSDLGRYYRLDKNDLINYYHLNSKNIELNYLNIVVILFYIKDIMRYKNIKRYVKLHILRLLERKKGNLNKDTEGILLLFDIISCPYLDKYFKRKVLSIFGVKTHQEQIINEEKHWFIKWKNLDLSKELLSKKSMEVYS